MRTLKATLTLQGEPGHNLELSVPEELALTCVAAVEGHGLFGLADGEPVRFAIEEPLDWETLRRSTGLVMRTPTDMDVVPVTYGSTKGEEFATTDAAMDIAGHLKAARKLESVIPRKRALRPEPERNWPRGRR